MANPGPRGRAPIGAGRGKMDFKVLGRLLKMLFRDYPVKMTIASVCVIVGALIDITPAAYIETITSYIEEGLVVGWDGVSAKIFSAILTMILLFTLNVILVASSSWPASRRAFCTGPACGCSARCRASPSLTLTATAAATS